MQNKFDHRIVAAKLLEQRQSDLLSPESGDTEKEDEEAGGGSYYAGAPVFQQLLFRFLDTEAPYFTSPQHLCTKKVRSEVANLILLFHELMAHDVFSHDAYMSCLISRGDLVSPALTPASSLDTIRVGPGLLHCAVPGAVLSWWLCEATDRCLTAAASSLPCRGR